MRRDSIFEQSIRHTTSLCQWIAHACSCDRGWTCRVWLGPNEAPRAILVGERKVTSGGVVVFRETERKSIRVNSIQTASTDLDYVDKTSNLLVFQAPRVGFEPTTRPLIPRRRDSTVVQVLANPTRRFQSFPTRRSSDLGWTCRVWLGPNEAPRAILVGERKVTSGGVVVFRE